MSNKPIPQLAPAAALVQLLHENPHLPLLDWFISDQGLLSGVVVNDDVDMRPIVDEYARVLGGTVEELRYTDSDGLSMYSASLVVTWRDVPVSVKGICLAASVTPAVAA